MQGLDQEKTRRFQRVHRWAHLETNAPANERFRHVGTAPGQHALARFARSAQLGRARSTDRPLDSRSARRRSGQLRRASSRRVARRRRRASRCACSAASRAADVDRAARNARPGRSARARDRHAQACVGQLWEERRLEVAVLAGRQRREQRVEEVIGLVRRRRGIPRSSSGPPRASHPSNGLPRSSRNHSFEGYRS